jgi:glycosyltransferase involved in cell wall biosynthesis
MKIAILGTRGIPARYGGFETLADQLSKRLVDRGHEVAVYCRRAFTRPDDVFDARIRRVILPSVHSKYLDTLVNGFLSGLHVTFTDAEVVLVCNVANSPFVWIPRVFGKPTLLNVDGLDRKRAKWNFLGQWFLHVCEMLSVFTPTCVVTDACVIQEYYRERYRKNSTLITYGAEVPDISSGADFGLPAKKYILYVSRLEPENNPELVIRAYKKTQTDWPLVIVGGNPYRPEYVQHLKDFAGERVLFTGSVYDEDYWTLLKRAGVYIYAGEIGGVHPALVEAMAAGNAILYLDNPANQETVANCGLPFEKSGANLSSRLQSLIANPELRRELASGAEVRAEEVFGWDEIVSKYETLLRELVAEKPQPIGVSI